MFGSLSPDRPHFFENLKLNNKNQMLNPIACFHLSGVPNCYTVFVHFLVSGIYIGPHNQVFEFLLEF